MKKRLLTVLLALILIVSAIPFAASAATTERCCTKNPDFFDTGKKPTCGEAGLNSIFVCNTHNVYYTYSKQDGYIPHSSEEAARAAAYREPTGEHVYENGVCECGAKENCEHSTHTRIARASEPTCTVDGAYYDIYKCNDCGATWYTNNGRFYTNDLSEVIRPAAHNYGDGVDCLVCGKRKPGVPACDHDNAGSQNWVPVVNPGKNATCLEDGYLPIYQCSICGVYGSLRDSGAVIYGSLDEAKEALTIAAPGKHSYKNGVCTACGHCKNNHKNTIEIPATEATCTMGPMSAGVKCATCGEILVKPKATGYALKHDYDEGTVITAATCTEAGEKEIKCQRKECNRSYTEEIPATGHNVTNDPATMLGEPVQAPSCVEKNEPGKGKFQCTNPGCDYWDYREIPCVECKIVDVDGQEPTCTESGWTVGKKCEICEKVVEYRTEIEPMGHDFSGKVTIKREASCDKYGLKVTQCTRCDAISEVETFDKLAHTLEVIPATEATCAKVAMTAGEKCSVCGTVTIEPKETGKKLDHNMELVEIYQEATCTEDGWGRYDCTGCGYAYNAAIEATGHTVVDVDEIPATCTAVGYTAGKWCSACDATLEGRDEIKALGHEWSNAPEYLLNTLTEPTCKEVGRGEFKCTRCDAKGNLDIPCVECEPELWPGRDATCTETGRTDGEKCKFCGKVMTNRGETEALGHNFEFLKYVNDVEPTCTEGTNAWYVCSACNKWEMRPVEAKGHTIVDIDEVPATCTEPGSTAGKWCSVCDATLEGRDGIEPLGHDYSVDLGYREGDEPTCLEEGIRVLGCSRCDEKTAQIAPKVACVPELWPGRAPTCKDTGLTDGERCKVCKNAIKLREVIPTLDHILVLSDFISTEPTCTEKGWGRYVCEREGCDYHEGGWVPALGHDYVEQECWEATCTKDGITETVCSHCQTLVRERIPATGHTEEIIPAVPATCTATGLTEGKKCATCNVVLEAQEEEAIKAHTWTEQPGLNATCTADGYSAFQKCAACGAEEGKTVIEAAHNYNGTKKCTVCGAGDPLCKHENAHIEHIDSTCTVAGSENFNCTACGYQFKENLPLAAHQTEVQSTPATCTTTGLTRKVCTVCQQVLESIEIPKAAHNFSNGACTACGTADPNFSAPGQSGNTTQPGTSGCQHADTSSVINPATCITDGYEVVTCNICKTVVRNKLIPALGHTNTTNVQPATCTKNGVKTVTCDRCDKYDYTVLPATGRHNYVNGICTTCTGADPNRFTNDHQDVFLLEDDAKG